MKKLILATYLFFCTGGTYAQQRFSDVFKKADFGTVIYFPPGGSVMHRSDTIRATLLITRGHMQIAHEKPGYVVYRSKDTIYLDDRKMVLKAPVKVWLVISQ